MEKTLTEVCEYLNNYFWRSKRTGKIVISDGRFTADYLKEGQYFRIIGSVYPENNGVHIYPATDLQDEVFEGAIWSMAVPQAVIDLASDIKAWQEKYGAVDSVAMSPFNSESYNHYSYSKGSNTSDGSSPNSCWAVFGSRLAPYRRLRGL